MSDDKPVFVQRVELLGVAEAVANEQPVIVITIRPDPSTFRPHTSHSRRTRLGGSLPIWEVSCFRSFSWCAFSWRRRLAAVQELRLSRPSGVRHLGSGPRLRLTWSCCDFSRLSRLLKRRPENHRQSPLRKRSP